MTIEKKPWHTPFYEDESNIAIWFFKKACLWIMYKVPDASLVYGPLRYLINFFAIFGTAACIAWAFTTSPDIITLFLKVYLASFVPVIAFSKTWAAAIYRGIEAYQKVAKSLFGEQKPEILEAEKALQEIYKAE